MQHRRAADKPETSAALPGPPVVMEFFEALRVSGKTLIQYDSERGAIAKFHTALLESLRYLITMDQLDPTRLLCAEYLTRWVVLIESATQKNPKQPDWDGLEVMVSGRLKESGAAELPGFTTWLTGVQRDHAQILKQGRMLREERAAERKQHGGAEKGEK